MKTNRQYVPFRDLPPEIKGAAAAAVRSGETFEVHGVPFRYWHAGAEGEPWFRSAGSAALLESAGMTGNARYAIAADELSDSELREWAEHGTVLVGNYPYTFFSTDATNRPFFKLANPEDAKAAASSFDFSDEVPEIQAEANVFDIEAADLDASAPGDELTIEGCRAIAAVLLPDRSLYIHAASRHEVSAELPSPNEWIGECRHAVGPAERAFIEAREPWHGPEPLILLDVEAHASGVELATTLIHELAHATKRRGITPPADPPTSAEAVADHLTWMAGLFQEFKSHDLAPWEPGHGARFIRAALHLAFRARAIGVEVDVDTLCAGEYYGLSPAGDYLLALGDECERLRDATFDEIEATEAPAAFTELFQQDTQAFEEN